MSPIQTRKIIDCPTERRIEPSYQLVSRPASGLEQIADDGRPVGLQVIGLRGADNGVLEWAAAIEALGVF